MRTIADKYIDEGVQKGMVQGMQIGRNEGMQIGRNEEKYTVAKNMLANNHSIPEVSRITGLSIFELNNLLKSKS